MRTNLVAGLAALALGLAPKAQSQPSDIYENSSVVIVPSSIYPNVPAVDALSFVNDSGALWELSTSDLWEPTDTVNFTNRGSMFFSPGLDFQTYPSDISVPHRAASFVNLVGGGSNGVINCSGYSIVSVGNTVSSVIGNSRLLVDATNIFNSGAINMDSSSLMKFTGQNIDFSRGTLSMASPSQFLTAVNGLVAVGLFNSGILDGYWAIDTPTNAFNPTALTGFLGNMSITPFFWVTNRNYQTLETDIPLTAPGIYQLGTPLDASNTLWQIAFIGTADPAISNTVYLNAGLGITVEWQWAVTNVFSGSVTTNFMYMTDDLAQIKNPVLGVDGIVGIRPTFRPSNYGFFQGVDFGAFGLPPATPTTAGQLFLVPSSLTNSYTAYEAIMFAGGSLPGDVPGGNVTNMAGRVEISAERSLNLTDSRITSLSYLQLNATNHFAGSQGAQILSPALDLNLRSTNGVMALTNLVPPYLPFPEGTIDCWSGLWTNVVNDPISGATMTNRVHALFVNTQFLPSTTPYVQTLHLTVTNAPAPQNLLISDVLNVTSDLSLNARSITLATNAPGSITPAGQLNLYSGNILWPTATPGLLWFTNWGVFSSYNTVFFGGARTQPPYSFGLSNAPYQAFVNHGLVSDAGSFVSARYIENSGVIEAGPNVFTLEPAGSISLQQAVTASLRDGALLAPGGDINISSASLLVSNHVFQAAGVISLAAPNLLSDGAPNLATLDPASLLTATVTGGNNWQCGAGLSLLSKPAQGDLLGTTVLCTAATNTIAPMVWAAEDRGPTVLDPANSGFFNNAALGRLILDGQDATSIFSFSGPDSNGSYALYVDCLEFRDATASTQNGAGDWTGAQLADNFKVYFAQAVADGSSIAEKLNGRSGGRFVWVSNYNYGYFSSTNLVYADGTTNRVNAALAQSCVLSSNPSGLPNCHSKSPIFPIPTWSPVGNDTPALPNLLPTFVADPFSLPRTNAGSAFTGAITIATNAVGPQGDTLTFGKVSGPAWLNIAARGALSGTPANTDAGLNTFVVSVTDTNGLASFATMFIYINGAPSFTSNPLSAPAATPSQAYSATIAANATDPNGGSLAFAKAGGPAWLNVAANGMLSGMPSSRDTGLNTFTVRVSDPGGLSSVATLNIIVGNIAGGGPNLLAPRTGASGGSVNVPGSYHGLFYDTSNGVTVASSGYFTANVTAKSKYSGKVTLAGHNYSVSGTFDALGLATNHVRLSSTASLTVLLQCVGDQILGSLSNSGANWSADLVADRQVFSKTLNPLTPATYTMVIPPDSNSSGGPSGSGFGTVKVDAGGNLQWSVVLADGTKVTQSTALSKQGYWPLYASLYSNGGSIISWAQTNLTGEFVWTKPRFFTNAVQAGISSYTPPKILATLLGTTNGNLVFSGGPLSGSVSNTFSLDARNRVKTAPGTKLSFTLSSGLFQGSLTLPPAVKVNFQGVLFGDNGGAGFFLGSGWSGAVELNPAP
jgi:hypothetical protein